MFDGVWRPLTGALLAVLVAAFARRQRALSPGGAIAAVLVGTAVVAGGWWPGVILVAFFATSSALSHRRVVDHPAADFAARGSQRDAVQVLANGGVAAVLAVLTPFASATVRPILFAGFAGAIAAATADTWATELGTRSPAPPRLILGGLPVAPGTSGGVTPLGTLAAVAGAGLIAALAATGAAAGWVPGPSLPTLAVTAVAGTAGSLADSLLGATVQAAYRCPTCNQPTERRVHRCGTRTILVRGRPAVTNDVVNAAATLVGAFVGVALTLAA